MANIDTATMKSLLERLNTIAKRIEDERDTEIPAERISAGGDSDLLARLDSRVSDLEVATRMHVDAKAAFMAAREAFKANPVVLATQYSAADTLAVQIEAVLDYRCKPGDIKATKVDTTTTDTPKGKPAAKDDKSKTTGAPKGTDEGKDDSKSPKADTGKKDGTSDTPTDPVLAAVKALTDSCEKNHTDAMAAITALEPRLITPELAAIINGLTPEQLTAVLNRRELTPLGAELMNVLAGYTPEELTRLLAGLNVLVNGNFLDRFKFPWGPSGSGSNAAPSNGSSPRVRRTPRPGSHL